MHTSDGDLLMRWRRRQDADAFSEIVARHAGMVYTTCNRVLGSPADAEDVTQDCFFRLANDPRQIKTSLAGWLHKLATHRAIDKIRSEQRLKRRERRFAEAMPHAVEAGWDDIQAYVDEAIAGLPDKLRGPVVRHYLEGGTYSDIAAAERIARATAKSRVERGVESIRKSLKEKGIPVTVPVLASLLGAESASALPVSAALMASLGKLALAGASTGAVGAAGLGGLIGVKTGMIIAATAIVATAGLVFQMQRPEPPQSIVPLVPVVQTPTPVLDPVVTQDEVVPEEAPVAGGPSGTLLGRVTVAITGEPVADVRVHATKEGRRDPNETITDADGVFRFANLEAGTWRVAPGERNMSQARSMGNIEFYIVGSYVWKGSSPRVELIEGEDAEPIVFKVYVAGMITGRVYDAETGEGLPGVAIKSYGFYRNVTRSGRRRYGPSQVDTVTDATGHYRFVQLEKGNYSPQAKAPTGYADDPAYEAKDVKVAKGSAVAGIDIPFIRGIPITGIVLGRDGEPVSEGAVFLDEGGYTYKFTEVEEDGTFSFYRSAPVDAVTVFAISAPLHGELGDVWGQVDAISDTIGPMALGRGGLDGLVLRLNEPARVSGVVVDADGNPVEGVKYKFKNMARQAWEVGEVAGTGGRFEAEQLPAGEHEIRVDRPDDYEEGLWITVTRLPKVGIGQNLSGVVVQTGWLKKAAVETFSISGRVLDAARQPVSATVLAKAPDEQNYRARVSTLDNGMFTITDLKPGTYTVGAGNAVGHSPVEMMNVAAGSTGIEFILPGIGAVEGVVISAETGQPIVDFEVRPISDAPEELVGYSYSRLSSFSGESGVFTLGSVPIGDTALTVQAEGYQAVVHEVGQVREGQTVSGVVVRLGRGGVVEGIVTNMGGEPVEGVAVNDGEIRAASFDALTDSDGRYRMDGLSSGIHTLHATHGDYSPARVPVRVFAGRTSAADIQLVAGGTVEGSVTLEGRVTLGASVAIERLSRTEMASRSGRVGTDGRYRIARIPAGETVVTASLYVGEREMTLERDVVTVDGQVTSVDFDFPAYPDYNAVLEGAITYHGELVKRASVHLYVDLPSGATTGRFYQDVEADGTYAFTELPPGTGKLLIFYASPNGSLVHKNVVNLISGEVVRRDVELVDSGATIAGRVLVQPRRGTFRIIALTGVVDTTTLDATAVLFEPAGERSLTNVQEDGTFLFEAHQPGTYTLIPHLYGSPAYEGRFLGPPVVVSIADGEEVFVDLAVGL